jgi:hypothetical protein
MGGYLNIPQGEDIGQAWASGQNDPTSRKRLLQMVMGSDPSATMDPPQNDRIADDTTRSPQGFEDEAPQMAQAGRMALADQIRQQREAQPSHLDQLQQQYDTMQPPAPPKPPSLLKKILYGALAVGGGGQGLARGLQQQRENQQFEESRYDRNRSSLLQQIEAERRMQEQEQAQSEREAAAQESQGRQFAQQPPHTIDTGQGPMQWDPATRQWSPIMANGQPVGPKAQPKPDTPEQQFFDSPEEAGKTLAQKIKDYANASQKPEQPQRPPQQLAVTPEGKVIDLKPGMQISQGTQSVGGMEKGATAGQAGQDALSYANDYMASGRFTGAGDEALMEKFFELAKPSSGFRMTQAQIEMLQHARNLMGSLSATAKHLFMPEAPYFSDTQRKQIVETMTRLEGSKGGTHTQGGAQHVPGGKAQGLKEGDTGTGTDNKKYVVRGGIWVAQ